jgi:transposase InsO family protein
MQALLHFVALIIRCAPALFRSQNEQVIVELALRQQLATYSQQKVRSKITPLDRVFWVALFRFWPRWKRVLVIVNPDTVVRWHRKGFGLYWRWISKRGPGRPPVSLEVQALIKAFALDNGWGARKVHAELGKLGFTVSLATVSRYMPKHPRDKGKQQRWMTFLRNHRAGIDAMDFFVVPTITFRLLYVWFVIDHRRRRIIHVNVTTHPTSSWVVQQIRNSFPDDSAPKYLIFDNDAIFSSQVSASIESFDITPKRTAYRSPWQNGTAERWVGSCKRELIDHVIALNESHLRRLLRDYVHYYNTDRVHTSLQDSPEGRKPEARPSPDARVVGLPRVGGLHHRYIWQEAA